MLRINKSLNVEQDNILECMETLEKDLEFAVTDFKQLMDQLRERQQIESAKLQFGQGNTLQAQASKRELDQSIQKLEKLEKSLLDSSINLGKIKPTNLQNKSMSSVSNLESRQALPPANKLQEDAEKLKKMQQELDSRKKLNQILIREFQKLKIAEKADQNTDSAKKQRELDRTMQIRASAVERVQNRLNMSQLNLNEEKERYFKLKDEPEPAVQQPKMLLELEPPQLFETFHGPRSDSKRVPLVDQTSEEQENLRRKCREITQKNERLLSRTRMYEEAFGEGSYRIRELNEGKPLKDLLQNFDKNLVETYLGKDLQNVNISSLLSALESIELSITEQERELNSLPYQPDAPQIYISPAVPQITQENIETKALENCVTIQQEELTVLEKTVQVESQRSESLRDNIKSLKEVNEAKQSKISTLRSDIEALKAKIDQAKLVKQQKAQPIEIVQNVEVNVDISQESAPEPQKIEDGPQAVAGEEETECSPALAQVDHPAKIDGEKVPAEQLEANPVQNTPSLATTEPEKTEETTQNEVKSEIIEENKQQPNPEVFPPEEPQTKLTKSQLIDNKPTSKPGKKNQKNKRR